MPIDLTELGRPRQFLGLSSHEVWILFGTISVLVVAFVIWAVFFRKPPRTHSPYLTERPTRAVAGRSGRRRRRRREHRPRNPTLAETGGLPPPRRGPPPGL